jgi:hypothetical protein
MIQTSSVKNKNSDLDRSKDCFSTISEFLTSSPEKSISLAAQGFHLSQNYELAKTCDTATGVLSGVNLLAEVVEVPSLAAKVYSEIKRTGFSVKILDPTRLFFKNIGKIFVDLTSVLNISGINFSGIRIFSKISPIVDCFVQANDVFENIVDANVDEDGLANKEHINAINLKKKQYICEIAKNSLLLISSAALAVGLVVPAVAFFAVSITAFVLSLVAFFIKQERIEEREKILLI